MSVNSPIVGAGAVGLAALFVLVPVGAALAGDLDAGRRLANAQCSSCHGVDGLAVHPESPHIAGESVFYLKKQLIAFRSGERQHQLMSIVAKGLSDTDIENVSTYYNAIEITATPPPRD